MAEKSETNQLALVVLFLGLLVIGGLFYFRNQELQLEKDKQTQAEQEAKRDSFNESINASNEQARIDFCVEDAETEYWKYVELNATSSEETPEGTVYTASQLVWDTAESNKQADI